MRKGEQNAAIRIGTSGYQYDHWRELFYPVGLAKKDWLAHYTTRFDAVELNNTFYRLPTVETFERWAAQAPAQFCYALKFNRFGSHMKYLGDPEATIGRFLERAEALGPHLGPILVQLPPRWKINAERLDAFLDAAPRHLRWAVEFREPSWLCAPVFEVLRRHGTALCLHDKIPNHPQEITANWVYFRFHGPGGNVAAGYAQPALQESAQKIRQCHRRGLDVYAFFNNDVGGHALFDAAALQRLARKRSGRG